MGDMIYRSEEAIELIGTLSFFTIMDPGDGKLWLSVSSIYDLKSLDVDLSYSDYRGIVREIEDGLYVSQGGVRGLFLEDLHDKRIYYADSVKIIYEFDGSNCNWLAGEEKYEIFVSFLFDASGIWPSKKYIN